MKQHDPCVADQKKEPFTADAQVPIKFQVNGVDYQSSVSATETLSYFLRGELGLTGLKVGCGEGECGACTVLIDNQPVNSCLVLAFQVDGKQITTIEGMAGTDGTLCQLQQAFIDHGAVQCGFCTPGMVMASEGLLRQNTNPSDAEIRQGLAGNICRCTGFLNIVKAVKSVTSQDNTLVVE